MRWLVKATLQGVMSRVPCGRVIYRVLQDFTGTRRLDIHDHYGMKARFLKRIQAQNLPIEGRSFLEIGTGWYPVLPLLLYLLGAKRVLTIDLNPWLTPRTFFQTATALTGVLDRMSADFHLSADHLKARLAPLLDLVRHEPDAPLSKALPVVNMEYRMPCNACATGLPANQLDYIISSNVLEHVPPEIIKGICAESKRILKSDGTHLHHINPGDHFAEDPRITTVNFLRYSSRTWYFLGGSGIAYHNRLRCIDYVRLFEECGFRILHTYTNVDQRALETLQTGAIQVHADFQKYSSEELASDIIDVFAVIASN